MGDDDFYGKKGMGCKYPSVVLGIFLVALIAVAVIKFGTQSTTLTFVHNYAYIMMFIFFVLAVVGGYGVAYCPPVKGTEGG